MMTLEMSEDGKNYDMVGTVRATSVFLLGLHKMTGTKTQEEGAEFIICKRLPLYPANVLMKTAF